MNPLFKPKLIAGNSNRPLATAIARRISMHRGETVELVKTRVERFNDARDLRRGLRERPRRGHVHHPVDVEPGERQPDGADDHVRRAAPVLGAPDHRGDALLRLCPAGPPLQGPHADRAKLVANLLTVAGDRAGADPRPARGADPGLLRHAGRQPLCRAGLRPRHPRTTSATSPTITVVSPDVGGVARARELAERINADLAIVDKRRGAPGEIASMTVIGDVEDRVCVIVDDICDTAGTLVKAAELLISHGATRGARLHHPRRALRAGGRAHHGLAR